MAERIERPNILRLLIGALVGAFVFVGIPETARWINGGAFAQSQTTPNPAPGSQGQSGGTTCTNINGDNKCGNTFNFGPQKLAFSEDIANLLITKYLTDHKRVRVEGVGSLEDIGIAQQYANYFASHGYDVEFSSAGMVIPPPSKKITIGSSKDAYSVEIAPSLP
jgi:hypothetical protein